MNVRAAVCSLLLVASPCAQDLPAFELPADVAAKVRELTGEAPMQLLAKLGDPDRGVRLPAFDHWAELDARARCALVRRGLRVGGAAAIGAAALAGQGEWLDLAETKVAVRAGLAVCNLVDTPFDVGGFFKMFDGEDTALFLANPGPMPREVPQFLGLLHRSLGREHFAAIEQLARGDDLLLRQEAQRYLGVLPSEYERIAAFLVTRPLEEAEPPPDVDIYTTEVPYVPGYVQLRPAGGGHPPLLAALLEDAFLARGERDRLGAFVAFRWAHESRPGEDDRELLLRLARCEHDDGRRIAVAGLARLGGEGALEVLREVAAGQDPDAVAPLLALAELARSGDAAARARLADPGSPPLALAHLWQVARTDAEAALDEAFGEDPEVGRRRLWRVIEAAGAGVAHGVPMVGLEHSGSGSGL